MPKSIVLFECTAYLALILGIASVPLNWALETAAFSQNPVGFIVVQATTFGLQILFIWLIARKRKNWARWIWVAFVFGGTAIAIALQFVHPLKQSSVAGAIDFYLVYLVSLVSGYFLLTRETDIWLRPHSSGQTVTVSEFD